MNYKDLTNAQLSAVLLYGHTVGALSFDLIQEIADRLDSERTQRVQAEKNKRFRSLAQVNKLEAIKIYRDETGTPLKDSCAYINGLLSLPVS